MGNKFNHPPLGRIQQLRKRKIQHFTSNVIAEQSEIPAFIKSLKNISKKQKMLSLLFFTLLIINLAVCGYQTADRILHYMDAPTTVDAYLIETTYGSFPYVYIFPATTQEFQDYHAKMKVKTDIPIFHSLGHLDKNSSYSITDIIKYMSIPSYITDAYFAVRKSRINLTVQNYEALIQPITQVSSRLQLPFGDNNYKMVIKLKFPYRCRWFYVLIDPSPINYQIYYNEQKFIYIYVQRIKTRDKYTIVQGSLNRASSYLQKYHFINTKKTPCDNNLHDCLRPCLL
uniref:Uncharacterized protein n=1 Tax=Strigamia maritima TaxID=126957 RepID=T1J6S2_STRMM